MVSLRSYRIRSQNLATFVISQCLAIFQTLRPVGIVRLRTKGHGVKLYQPSVCVWPKLLSPKVASTFGAFLQGFPKYKTKLYTDTLGQPSQNRKPTETAMEIRSPPINQTTQLDAACHTDLRNVSV
jgi:hypothetical protein